MSTAAQSISHSPAFARWLALIMLLASLGAAEDGESGEVPLSELEERLESNPVLDEARALAGAGRESQALQLLETYLATREDDQRARRLYLELRIAQREAEMRALLAAAADEKEYVLGDPAYETAKAQSPAHISRQLDIVEHLIQEQRFTKAVDSCGRILDQQQ